MGENLLAQERVCVFLSLLLHNFSAVFPKKIRKTLAGDFYSCLDSFSKHIYGVMGLMADNEAGVMLSEFLEELLSFTVNGENVALVSKIALIDHLVAGISILAAICTSQDRVGFTFEASFEICTCQNFERATVSISAA